MVRKFVGCLLLGLLALGGCDALRSPEQVVARRAQARWDALVKGDLKAAYAYLSPGYRKAMSYERYQRGIFGVGKWQAAKVDQVSCQQPEVCAVTVQVTIRLVVPRRGEPIESTSPVYERWVKDSGKWWYVPDR